MKREILDCFYTYVAENMLEDHPGKFYIDVDIEDPAVQSVVEKLGYRSDEFYELEEVINDLKKIAPKGYTCETELLVRYDAGFFEGTGAYTLLYIIGKNALVISFLSSGFETFIYDQTEFILENNNSEDITENVIQLIQWSDSPHVQINSLYINDKYLSASLFLKKLYDNLGSDLNDVMISLSCHSDRLDSNEFLSRISVEESEEIKKIDEFGYDWKGYNKELLKNAFIKTVIQK